MKLSVVIPVYNSEGTIMVLVNTLLKVLSEYEIEIVLVNDASKDKSEFVCETIAASDHRVKFISLRRNSGEHNTVMCGLNHCTGDYIAIVDDDLQNPPSEIITLVNKAISGKHDVVYAKYGVKQHSVFRNFCSYINNVFAFYLLNKPKGLYLSSFKVFSKEILKEVIAYKGPFPYIDALILRVTDNIGSEEVLHESRKNGKSNYTLKKLLSLYLNVFINYSNRPLRLVTIAGIIISILSAVLSASIVYEKIFLNDITPGWSFLAVLLLFSIGATFIVIGLLGEYIGKIIMSLNNTPQFVIKKTINTQATEETNRKPINIMYKEEYDRESVRV
jgi:undecaprenyl-phosphate 4-deoxy-4-formamido-L-arabinose transferase